MKRLHDMWWSAEWLAEEARTIFGRRPTDKFEGEKLDVASARSLGAVLLLPGVIGPRIVVASYEEALPRALDTLLAAVEETEAHLIFACAPPLTETFRSRFQVAAERAWTVHEFYEQFGTLGREKNLDDLIAENPEVPAQRIHSLYDSYTQSLGAVGTFVSAVHDGNVEVATRTALPFGSSELDLLFAELEVQLRGETLVGRVLTSASRENLLTASMVRDSGTALSPSAQAVMIAHTLLV